MATLVDLVNGVNVGVTYPPAVLGSNTNTTGVDLLNGTIDTAARALFGVVPANTAFTLKVQECDTDTSASYVDIAGATFTANPSSNTDQTIRFLRNKRWVRCVATSNTNTYVGIEFFTQRKYSATGATAKNGTDRSPST